MSSFAPRKTTLLAACVRRGWRARIRGNATRTLTSGYVAMTPRHTLLTLTALACFTANVAAGETKRPNILFLFADDWGRYASAYAKVDGRPSPNDVVRTPNIDRLAREGVLFR